jgi:hypothetical protein
MRAGSEPVSFWRVWLTAYVNPVRAVEGLRDKPAPHWGLYGVLVRCAFVSLLWYLPAYLLGRVPSATPYLTFLTADNYYAAAILIFPLVTLMMWLLDGVLAHVVLRLMGRESDIDQILNIDGIGYAILGPPILVVDWLTLALGGDSAMVLWGLIHLVVDLWYILFVTIGLKRILRLPLWLAIALVVLWFVYSIPLAMLFFVP